MLALLLVAFPEYYASRTALSLDYPPHASLALWRPEGVPLGDVELVAGERRFRMARSEYTGQLHYDRYHLKATVVPGTPPGEYDVVIGGRATGVRVSVVRESRGTARLNPFNFLSVESLPPNTDVRLDAGYYVLPRPVRLPRGTRLLGYGATLTTNAPKQGTHAYDRLLFWPPSADVAFCGITFLVPNRALMQGFENLHMADCVVRSVGDELADFGQFNCRDLLVERCRFERVTLNADAGLVVDTDFVGLVGPRGESHSLCVNGSKGVMVARCRFDGTDRGPVLRESAGEVHGILMTGITLRDVGHVDNGNELLLFEPYFGERFSRCVFHRFRAFGCGGDVNLYNARVEGCVFNDFVLDDANVRLFGLNPQRGNVFKNMELRGGGFVFGGDSDGNVLENVAFVGFRKTRGNQLEAQPWLYSPDVPRPPHWKYPTPAAPIWAEGGGPRKVNVTYHRHPEGVPLEMLRQGVGRGE
jgi:hypothetical protein